jgi:hypothetical protein
LNLAERLASVGRDLAAREAAHTDALTAARTKAEELHAQAAAAIDAYHGAIENAPQLTVRLGDPKIDDKHLHAFEFDVRRGRHRAIVVVKSRGDVTMVGPFRMGKTEGPCRSIAFAETDELDRGLGELFEAFLHEAASP